MSTFPEYKYNHGFRVGREIDRSEATLSTVASILSSYLKHSGESIGTALDTFRIPPGNRQEVQERVERILA